MGGRGGREGWEGGVGGRGGREGWEGGVGGRGGREGWVSNPYTQPGAAGGSEA